MEGYNDSKFNYMMLSRLKSDCDYYLNNGGRSKNVLWAGDEVEQIKEMKRIYNTFSEDLKPEWLIMEDILHYEKLMVNNKMTKEIKIINVYNEEITVDPIDYNTALNIIELTEENSILMDKISKKIVELYNAGETDIKEKEPIKSMLKEHDKIDRLIEFMRKKHDYYYCGLDNLDIEDKKRIEQIYPRRK